MPSILIVEDGSCVANANSYIDVAFADTYHSNRGNTAWASLSSTVKEQCLLKASEYLDLRYAAMLKGSKVQLTQSLKWPREYVPYDDAPYLGSAFRPATELPKELKQATAETALKLYNVVLVPDMDRTTVSEKIGELEITYDKFGPRAKQFPLIDMILRPLIYHDTLSVLPLVRS